MKKGDLFLVRQAMHPVEFKVRARRAARQRAAARRGWGETSFTSADRLSRPIRRTSASWRRTRLCIARVRACCVEERARAWRERARLAHVAPP